MRRAEAGQLRRTVDRQRATRVTSRRVPAIPWSARRLWQFLPRAPERRCSPSFRLAHADPLLFAGATFCATAIFGLRARRWQTILEPVAGELPLAALWRATAIGMMVNNVVPARAGEIARAYALTKESPVPFATSLA